MKLEKFLKEQKKHRQENNLWRREYLLDSSLTTTITVAGREYLNFSSNNYLGLAGDARVKESASQAIAEWGAGTTASRLICGNFQIHRRLEEKIARLKNSEAALVFPSGYQTNLGTITALLGLEDAIFCDELDHASLIDAAKLSRAKIIPFRHRDYPDLEQKLKHYRRHFNNCLIVTDSLFSMDGDIADLPEIVRRAKKYDCWTMIDEAHATGIYGPNGGGIAEEQNCELETDILMGTLSKAIGSQGGFIAGKKILIEYIYQKARAFIYTTGLNPASCAAAAKAIEIINREPERRINLLRNAEYLRKKIQTAGYSVGNSASQIIPVIIGDLKKTVRISEKLFFEYNIFLPPIRPPTVPKNMCRLRISLTSEHSLAQIDYLAKSLLEELSR
jgi:8-amino-7-oxononanoate synthase